MTDQPKTFKELDDLRKAHIMGDHDCYCVTCNQWRDAMKEMHDFGKRMAP